MNRVELHGNVGKYEPEFRYATDGSFQSCTFNMATNESYRDRESKEWKTSTDWHRVVVKGKGHASLCEDIHAGTKVILIGKVKTRKYQDKDGQDKYITEIVVESYNGGVIEIIQPRRAASAGSQGNQQSSSGPQGSGHSSLPGGGDGDEGDDIPF